MDKLRLVLGVVLLAILCPDTSPASTWGMSIARDAYYLEEEVMISGNGLQGNNLIIENSKGYLTLFNLTSNEAEFRPNVPGKHVIRLVDQSGFVLHRKEFEVMELGLETSRSEYRPGDEVVIKAAMNESLHRIILAKDGNVTQLDDKSFIASRGTYVITIEDTGGNTLMQRRIRVQDRPGLDVVGRMDRPVESEISIRDNLGRAVKRPGKARYSVHVRPKDSVISEVRLFNASVSGNVPLKIEETDVSGFVQAVAIDPSSVDFQAGSITIRAKGTEVYKCRDWVFEEGVCTGDWVLLRSGLVPGELYTIEISPADPAFGEKGRIWQVQNGTVNIGVTNSNATVTIDEVNTSRAFVIFNQRTTATDDLPNRAAVYAKFNSSTEVTFYRNGSTGGVTVDWYVVEGSDIIVQSGNISYANTHRQRDVSLNPVNLSRYIAYATSSCDSANANDFHETFWTAEMTSETNLRLTRDTNTNCDGQIGYFVVEFNDGSTVITGDAALAASETLAIKEASGFNSSSSWMLFSKRADDLALQVTQTAVSGRIINDTSISFYRRSGTGALNFRWFIVDTPGAVVQSGVYTVNATNRLVQNQTLDQIDLSKSFPIVSWDSNGAATAYGYYYWTGRFTNDTNLMFQRNLSGQLANISWTSVQLNAPVFAVFWNESSIDLGQNIPQNGNISRATGISAYGDNDNVTVNCIGDCEKIFHNWTNGTDITGGETRELGITCSNETAGIFSATFSVISGNDTTESNITATCEMLTTTYVAWNQTSLSLGPSGQGFGNISGIVTVISAGYNDEINVSCAGDCQQIASNWTNGTYMLDGEETAALFECDDSTAVDYSALFYIVSSQDLLPSQINVTCSIIDLTAPSAVTGLGETGTSYNWILWNWTNPPEADFSHNEVFLNSSFYGNTTLDFINVSGLLDDTLYEIQVKTADASGNINESSANDTAATLLDLAPAAYLLAPANNSRSPELFRLLNVTADDTESSSFCLDIYASSITPTPADLVYRNCSYPNSTAVRYNYTAPLLQADANTEILWHFDNRPEYGEYDGFVQDFAVSVQNHSRSCTTTCPTFYENRGKFAGAYLYNGLSNYWLLDESYFSSAFSQRTFQAWIRPLTTAGARTIYEEGSSTAGMAVRINAGYLQFATRNTGAGSQRLISTRYIDTANWHLVTAVFNNSNLTLYVDEVLLNWTNATYSTINAHANGGGLGATYSTDAFGTAATGNYFSGYIDEVRILNYGMTESDVAATARLGYGSIYFWQANATDPNNAFATDIWLFNVSNGTVSWNTSFLNLGISNASLGNISQNASIISIGPNPSVNVSCEGDCGNIRSFWTNGTDMSHNGTSTVNFTCINISKGFFQAVFNVTSAQDSEPEQITVICEFFTDTYVIWNQSLLDLGITTQDQGDLSGYSNVTSRDINNETNISCEGDCDAISQDWTNGTDMGDGQTTQVQFTCSDSVPGSKNAVFGVFSANDTSPNLISVGCIVIDPPPGPVSGLAETDAGYGWILWNWTNPTDADYSHAEVWLNSSFIANATLEYINVSGILPSREYEIQIITADSAGNINTTWVNDSAWTLLNEPPEIALIEPADGSVDTKTRWVLNFTANDDEESQMCVSAYGSSASVPSDLELLYRNCSFANDTAIAYSWDAPVLSADAGTEALWHFDNRPEYGENISFAQNFAGSTENHSRGCTANCPIFEEGAGKFAGAYRYDGASTYFVLDESYFRSLFFVRAVQAWIRPTSTAGARTIYEEGTTTAGMALRINAGLLQFATRNTGAASQTTISTPYTDTTNWHLVTAFFNNGNLSLYVDGVMVNTTFAAYGSVAAHASNGGIGATITNDAFGSTATGSYFTGHIDDMRVLNYAPTPEQVQEAAGLSYGSTYHWFGSATDGYQSADTDIWKFTIADDRAPLVQINLSLNNTVTGEGRPNATFNASDNHYENFVCSLMVNGSNANTSSIGNWTPSALSPDEALSTGNYSVYVNCTDNEMNQGVSETIYIYVDRDSPNVAVTSPAPGTLNIPESVIEITATVTDDIEVAYVKANVSWNESFLLLDMEKNGDSYNYSFSDTVTESRYNVTIIAYDTFGNANVTETTFFIIAKDDVAPLVYMNSSLNNTITASDRPITDFLFIENRYSWANCTVFFGSAAMNSTNASNNTWTAAAPNQSIGSGNHTVYAACTDPAGNTGISEAIYILIDTVAPNVTDIAPLEGAAFELFETVEITALVLDHTDITYVAANITWNSGEHLCIMEDADLDGVYNCSFASTNASRHNVTIIARDQLGHENYTEGTWFLVEANSEINITLDRPLADSGDNDGYISFTYNVSSKYPVAYCSLYINGSERATSWEILAENQLPSVLEVGRFNWSILCEDIFSGQESSDWRHVSVIISTGFGGLTTDFSTVNVSRIENLVIDNPAIGRIEFNEDINLSDGLDLVRNVSIANGSVIVLDSELNKSATITMAGLPYEYVPVILKDGALCGAQCAIDDYSSGTLVFTVPGFSAYSVTANSYLAIFSQQDLGITIGTYEETWLHANYTNLTSEEPVSDASCLLSIDGTTIPMAYNASSLLFEAAWTFTSQGTYNWGITCQRAGFETAEAEDSVSIISTTGYAKTGYCTGEYVQRGRDSRDGYLQRGDILNIYCQPPRPVADDEVFTITIIPKSGMPVTKRIKSPEVISRQYETLYP